MRLSVQQLFPIIGLLIVAGASVWLERVTTDEGARTSTQLREEPDFIAEQTRLIAFDAKGRQHYELLSDTITHHPLSDVSSLERPRLRYLTEGRELHVSARNGEVLQQGDEVRLAGDVHADRSAAHGSPALSLASESLTIWPDDERAETSDPVELVQAASTAHGDGMKSDNVFGTLELIGNARMHFPRAKRNPQ